MAALLQTKTYPQLDGWRGISIALVLATHLLPLGPKTWQLNVSTGVLGMSLFFILSGFLITEFLLARPDPRVFILRRMARVLPLCFVYTIIALCFFPEPPSVWIATLGFYANLPPQQLVPVTAHLWSLCTEVQFYFAMMLWCLFTKARAHWMIVLACLGITALRIHQSAYTSSISYLRADEIMAGCLLALVVHKKLPSPITVTIARTPWWVTLGLLVGACTDHGGSLNYARAYLAAMLVGHTIIVPDSILARSLHNKTLAYIASISFALYIIHPFLAHTWLGEGDTLVRYSKRPLLFLVLWLLAHVSTKYLEAPFIAWGRRITSLRKSVSNAA